MSTTTAVTNQGCCHIQSPQTKKMVIGVAVVTALVSAILIALGAAGILPHVGNLAAISTGSILLAVSIVGIVIVLCMKKKETPKPKAETVEESVERERQEKIKSLMATINTHPVDQSVLWNSIHVKSVEAFKAAIQKLISQTDPANVLAVTDSVGRTIWHYIAFCGTPEMLSYLNKEIFDFLDEQSKEGCGGGVFHWAVHGNNPGVISTFAAWGADLHRLDEEHTPLHCAVVSGKLECVKALVEAGASLDVKNKAGDTIPAHFMKNRQGTSDCQAVAEYLVQKFPACKAELGV